MRVLKIFAGVLVSLVAVSVVFVGWLAWHHRPYAKPDWQAVFAEFEASGDCEAAKYLADQASYANDIEAYRILLSMLHQDHQCGSSAEEGSLHAEVVESMRQMYEERIAELEAGDNDEVIPVHSIAPKTPFWPFLTLLKRQWERNLFPGKHLSLVRSQMWVYMTCFNGELTGQPIAYHRIERAIQSVKELDMPLNSRRLENRRQCADLVYSIANEMKPYVSVVATETPEIPQVSPYFYENWLMTAREFGSHAAEYDRVLLRSDKRYAVKPLKTLALEKGYTPALLLLSEWYFAGQYVERSLEKASEMALIAEDQGGDLPDHLQALVDRMSHEDKTLTRAAFKQWRGEFVSISTLIE